MIPSIQGQSRVIISKIEKELLINKLPIQSLTLGPGPESNGLSEEESFRRK